MSWVEDRDRLYSGIPEFWNLFCIEIEETAKAFRRSSFAADHKLTCAVSANRGCRHVTRLKMGAGKPEGYVDLCLDEDSRRVFSRIGESEQSSLNFGLDAQASVCLLDSEGVPMSLQQACKFFLGEFLFAPR
jgi:hypothetical protein